MEPMKLRDALKALEPLETGYALALSTEGYSAEKDKLLAFTLVPLDGDAYATVYVAGGDVSKSNNVNQINPELYQVAALDAPTAWRQFIDLADLAPFVVAHNVSFALGFLRQLRKAAGPDAPELHEGKFVDSLILARTRGTGQLATLAELETVESVTEALASFPAPKRADGGCGLKALAEQREILLAETGPLCERNALTLERVFKMMLDESC